MKIVLSIDPAQPLAAYRDALLAAGARDEEILVVQPGDALPASFDGLLVSGGADVDPARYGETRVNDTVTPKPERDALDFALVEQAGGLGAAVFGICRGLQVLNVALGGTLWQDLPSQRDRGVAHAFSTRDGHDPAYLAHVVRARRGVPAGLPLATEIAALDGEPVNSRHHQAVKDLAPGLIPLAASPDDLPEAFARAEGPFLAAVQWHPENLVERPAQKALFAAFLDAARLRAAHVNSHASPGSRADGAPSEREGHQLASGDPGGLSDVRPAAEAPEPR
ncbi:MAG: gamma-glutamyl-gamma-aminobutyrate hydrolase family protein [Thermoanaerobaculia bacterium]